MVENVQHLSYLARCEAQEHHRADPLSSCRFNHGHQNATYVKSIDMSLTPTPKQGCFQSSAPDRRRGPTFTAGAVTKSSLPSQTNPGYSYKPIYYFSGAAYYSSKYNKYCTGTIQQYRLAVLWVSDDKLRPRHLFPTRNSTG